MAVGNPHVQAVRLLHAEWIPGKVGFRVPYSEVGVPVPLGAVARKRVVVKFLHSGHLGRVAVR
jgi:hypothetical protein